MKKNRTVSWRAALFAAALLSFSAPALAAEEADSGTYVEGIYLEEMSLQGMTPEEAKTETERRISAASSHTLTVQVFYGDQKAGSFTAALPDLGFVCQNPELLSGAEQLGHIGSLMTRFKERKRLQNSPSVYDLTYNWDIQKVLGLLNEQAAVYHVDPIEATVTKSGSEFYVTESRIGWDMDVDATLAQAMRVFSEWDEASDLVIQAVMVSLPPAASQEALMTIQDKLGEAVTYYSGDDSLGRNMNLILGTSLVNGSVVLPGEVFSVNGAMEPYDAEHGWQLG